MSNTVDFYDYLIEKLKDPEYAKEYLEIAFEESQNDHDSSYIMLALRNVMEAQGGVPAFAEQLDIPKMTLYKALSKNGNPRLDTLEKILEALGLRLSVTPVT